MNTPMGAHENAAHHRASHINVRDCWQCEPRASGTPRNNFLTLVEDPADRCRWCDGTGWYAYAAWLDARGDEWRPCGPCGQCAGAGQRRYGA